MINSNKRMRDIKCISIDYCSNQMFPWTCISHIETSLRWTNEFIVSNDDI